MSNWLVFFFFFFQLVSYAIGTEAKGAPVLAPISLSNPFPTQNWLVVAKKDLDDKQNVIGTRGRRRESESALLLMRYDSSFCLNLFRSYWELFFFFFVCFNRGKLQRRTSAKRLSHPLPELGQSRPSAHLVLIVLDHALILIRQHYANSGLKLFLILFPLRWSMDN